MEQLMFEWKVTKRSRDVSGAMKSDMIPKWEGSANICIGMCRRRWAAHVDSHSTWFGVSWPGAEETEA